MNEQLTVKYIKMKNKVRKIVTYKENGELRRYHEEVVKYLEKYVTNSIFAKAYIPKGIFSFALSIEKKDLEACYSENMIRLIRERGYDSLKELIKDLGNDNKSMITN